MANELRIPKEFKRHRDSIISNFDHEINEYVAMKIKGKKMYAQYAGWNFCGFVWWQDKNWHCEVWRYGIYIETFSADTLAKIKEDVSMEYGFE